MGKRNAMLGLNGAAVVGRETPAIIPEPKGHVGTGRLDIPSAASRAKAERLAVGHEARMLG